jgi:hypothetical protein
MLPQDRPSRTKKNRAGQKFFVRLERAGVRGDR